MTTTTATSYAALSVPADGTFAYVLYTVNASRLTGERVVYAPSAQAAVDAAIAFGYVKAEAAPAVAVNGANVDHPVRHGDTASSDTRVPESAEAFADRMSAYGVQTSGEVVTGEYHERVESTTMTLAEVAAAGGKVTRIRLLHEAGRFDVSYVHATLPGDRIVRVDLSAMRSSMLIPRNKLVGDLIEWAKAERVYAKGLDLLNPEIRAILW